VLTSARSEPVSPFLKDISIRRELENGVSSEAYKIGLDSGSVSGSPGADNEGRTLGRVRWEGRTLAFETGSYSGPIGEHGTWTERREEWTLDPDGRLRVTITNRSSVDRQKTATLMYRRE
jgi:hypothetical protein